MWCVVCWNLLRTGLYFDISRCWLWNVCGVCFVLIFLEISVCILAKLWLYLWVREVTLNYSDDWKYNSNFRVNNFIVTVGQINYWCFESEAITFHKCNMPAPLLLIVNWGKVLQRKALQEKNPTVWYPCRKAIHHFPQIMEKALYIIFTLLVKGLIIT